MSAMTSPANTYGNNRHAQTRGGARKNARSLAPSLASDAIQARRASTMARSVRRADSFLDCMFNVGKATRVATAANTAGQAAQQGEPENLAETTQRILFGAATLQLRCT